jgi:hypothetical protein
VNWAGARAAIAIPTLRVHDLRHTAASIWPAHGADPKVVQRVLGHATATMTMDLYGHLLDASLWLAADRIGDILGTSFECPNDDADAAASGSALTCGFGWSRLGESNPGPTHYECVALPTELRRQDPEAVRDGATRRRDRTASLHVPTVHPRRRYDQAQSHLTPSSGTFPSIRYASTIWSTHSLPWKYAVWPSPL